MAAIWIYVLAPHTLVFNDLEPWFSRLWQYFSREITVVFMKPLLTDTGSRASQKMTSGVRWILRKITSRSDVSLSRAERDSRL